MNDLKLASALGFSGKEAADFLNALDALEYSGKIIKTKKGKYILTEQSSLAIGTLSRNVKGFGFVIVDSDDQGDIFIPPNKMNHAMHGDRVMVELLSPADGKDDRRREGKIAKVIKHATEEIVGTFQKSPKFGFVVPDQIRLGDDIFVRKVDFNGAKNGDKVVVKVTKWATDEQRAEGHIIECIGSPSDPKTELTCLIRQYKLSETFPDKVLIEAESVPQSITEDEILRREDLRSKTIITIDGADAKDLDDAVSVSKNKAGNYVLGVHIADVSHYIHEGSKLDREALKRGNSVYLIDTVLPMLPKNISNGICSLHSGVDRLTLSVEMEIDEKGKTVSHRIFESVINSRERMVYSDVSDILENQDEEMTKKYSHILDDLTLMDELFKILAKTREERGSVDFDFDEAYITLNKSGVPVDVKIAERRSANRLIEEFMLKANETIAEHHFWLDIPFVYRVHETPDPEKMEAFKKFVWNFGYTLKGSSENVHPKTLSEIVKHFQGQPSEHVVNTVMLRSMKKAVYMPECKGHFGLGLKYYSHFTSPIRRYPDLIIHRIIKENLNSPLSAQRLQTLVARTDEASKISSETERTAQEIERELEKLKKAEYMIPFIDDKFDGIISGVTGFGIFVELPNTIEGIIRLNDMHDDYYTFEKEKYRLVGDRTKKMYTLGDKISIRVSGVDLSAKEISFEII